MTDKRNNIHNQIYYFGLIVIIVGLPLSKILMSLGQIILAANWLLHGNPLLKFKQFFKNAPAVIISSILLMHFIGLIHSTDYNYAFNDMRIKLPLFLLPLFFSTSEPLSKKSFERLLLIFIASVFAATVVSTYIIFTEDLTDLRDASRLISHIRFSLLICLAIFILARFIFADNNYPKGLKLVFLILSAWFIAVMIIAEWFTGIAVFIITSLSLFVYFIFRLKNGLPKIILSIGIIIIPLVLILQLRKIVLEYTTPPEIDFSKLDRRTANGFLYSHDTLRFPIENGTYVGLYLSWDDMELEWKNRSGMDLMGKDKLGQKLRYTLVRYLNSKGLRKDSIGISKLTEEDIAAIENGVANHHYLKSQSIKKRIYQILWEVQNYKLTRNPSGHSVMQRLEYWRTASLIIKKNWLVGVGTGDVQMAFDQQYDIMDSKLKERWRLRTHNQFLTIAVTFGFLGLAWFIFALFYPPLKRKVFFDYFFFTFFIIALISMLTEDTLETQAGATFFTFFYSLFIFGKQNGNSNDLKEND